MARLEIQDDAGHWIPLLEVNEDGRVVHVFELDDPGLTKVEAQIQAETAALAAKMAAEERAKADDEEPPVPTCPACGSVTDHTPDCPRREAE
jgi:hypothetical protein